MKGGTCVASAALAVLLCACGDDDACTDLCDALDRCGFLPSPFGGGDSPSQNCRERCIRSEDVREEVRSCLSSVIEADDHEDPWCSTGTDATNPCRGAATCLRRITRAGAFSTARVSVVPMMVGEGLSPERASTPGATQECADRPGESCCSAVGEVTDICSLGVAGIDYFAAQDGRLFRDSSIPPGTSPLVDCTAGLSAGALFELQPGPAYFGVRVRGASSSESGEPEPFCWVFYSERFVVRAADPLTVPIAMPSSSDIQEAGGWPIVCEQGPERCADGEDNDGNGHVDCADPGCIFECLPRELCANGSDDDEDGDVDCADTNCTREATCDAAAMDGGTRDDAAVAGDGG